MILMYHNLAEHSSTTLSYLEFIKQMDYIRNGNHYNILSLDQYVENLLNPTINNPVIITFDDGYVSLSTMVLPIIKQYEIPVSIFIPVGYVGMHNIWDTRNGHPKINILTWEELKELSKEPLITIGSHGFNHLTHGKLEEDKDYHEIAGSKEVLEKNLGIEVKYYSFPYGQFKDIGMYSIHNLKKAGYKAALSTNWSRTNSKENIFCLNRLEIQDTDDLTKFKNKLESKIDWRYLKQKIKNVLS